MDLSAILVPVPSAEPLVASWRKLFDPVATAGVPAHITVLFPFLPPAEITAGVEADLRTIFARTPAFNFLLAETGRFPNALYIAPAPRDVWESLTRSVCLRFPTCPPYGGKYDTIVPHLTVADGVDQHILDEIESAISGGLPIVARASEAWIMESSGGEWSLRTVFPLARSNA